LTPRAILLILAFMVMAYVLLGWWDSDFAEAASRRASRKLWRVWVDAAVDDRFGLPYARAGFAAVAGVPGGKVAPREVADPIAQFGTHRWPAPPDAALERNVFDLDDHDRDSPGSASAAAVAVTPPGSRATP
jgi:hypothetical protein